MSTKETHRQQDTGTLSQTGIAGNLSTVIIYYGFSHDHHIQESDLDTPAILTVFGSVYDEHRAPGDIWE